MRNNDTAADQMVQNYSPLIKAFIDGRISPEDFATAYLAKSKATRLKLSGRISTFWTNSSRTWTTTSASPDFENAPVESAAKS